MKNSFVIAGLAALALLGCKTDLEPTNGNSPVEPMSQQAQVPLSPRYGWEEFHEETFETHPLQAKWFAVPPSISRLRVSVQADSAIFGGVFPYDFLSTNRRLLRAGNFQGRPCSLMYVDKSEATCLIDKHVRMGFLVRDERAEGTAVMGALGIRLRNSKLAERGTSPNKIQISLAAWQCIEHCRKS